MMNAKSFIWKSLLAGLMVLAWGACSSDTDLSTAEVETEDLTTSSQNPKLSVTIKTTKSSDVVSYTRADGEIQTEEETEIYTLNIYLFALDDNDNVNSATDDNYYYYKKYTFTYAGDNVEKEADSTFGDDGYGNMTCDIEIQTDMLDKTVKVVMIANDDPTTTTTVTEGETTLTTFKTSLATASVSNTDHVDVLVGNPYDDSPTGYPMSAQAYIASEDTDDDGNTTYTATDTEWAYLSVIGADMTATLVRTMARVDVFNWIPNLTITDIYIRNTPDQSYLFAQDDHDEPSSSSYILLNALSTYCDDDGNLNEIAFVDTDDDGNEIDVTNEDKARELNTTEYVLYMYEQAVEENTTNVPTIYIKYEVDLTGGDETNTESLYEGLVTIPFYKKTTTTTTSTDEDGTTTETESTETEYINVVRNHRYTIVLGEDGQNVTGKISYAVVVNEWVNTLSDGETEILIETELDIYSDGKDTSSTTEETTDDE